MIRELFQILRSDIRPFHDDFKLQSLIEAFVVKLQINTFYETGTFRGDTLEWMNKQFPWLPSVSVECNRTYAVWSKLRVYNSPIYGWLPEPRVICGDSATMPRLSKITPPVLFWLDAHWHDKLPLPSELQLIKKSRMPCAILVDDFQHPRKPLGFDTYNGQPIGLNLVSGLLDNVYVPNYDAPRGYAVSFQGLPPMGLEFLEPA
jgi:hypothetical protein